MKRALTVLACVVGLCAMIPIAVIVHHNWARRRALADLEERGFGASQIEASSGNSVVTSPEKGVPSVLIGDTYIAVKAREYPMIGRGIRIDALRYPFEGTAMPGDEVIASIARFPELRQLDISGANRIVGVQLTTLPPLPNLVQLQINNGQLTDDNVGHLAKFDAVEFLSLANQPISDRGMAHLSHLSRLTELCLVATQVHGTFLRDASYRESLTTLHLGDSPVTDAAADCLTELPNLQYVDLGEGAVTGELVERLRKKGVTVELPGYMTKMYRNWKTRSAPTD